MRNNLNSACELRNEEEIVSKQNVHIIIRKRKGFTVPSDFSKIFNPIEQPLACSLRS